MIVMIIHLYYLCTIYIELYINVLSKVLEFCWNGSWNSWKSLVIFCSKSDGHPDCSSYDKYFVKEIVKKN